MCISRFLSLCYCLSRPFSFSFLLVWFTPCLTKHVLPISFFLEVSLLVSPSLVLRPVCVLQVLLPVGPAQQHHPKHESARQSRQRIFGLGRSFILHSLRLTTERSVTFSDALGQNCHTNLRGQVETITML